MSLTTQAQAANLAREAARLRRRGKPGKAKSLLQEAIRLSPESPRLYVQLALCEVAIGDERLAREAMENFSRHAMAKTDRLADYRAYLEKELIDHAFLRQVFYDAAAKLDRTDAGPFLAQAKARMEAGDADGALKALIAAVKTKTRESEVRERLREFFIRTTNEEALGHLDRYESGALARKDFVTLIYPDGKPAEKNAAATATQEREEKTLGDLIAHLEDELGLDIDESRDNVKPLITEFRRRSQKVLGKDPQARIDMAMAYFEMGLHEEARAELAEISERDRRYPEALCLLGEIQLRTSGLMGALDAYQKCLRCEQAPEDARNEARYRLVQIYGRLGDWANALEHARKLEDRCPGYRDIHALRLAAEEAVGKRRAG